MMELQQSCMFQLAAQVVVSTCISFKGSALVFTSQYIQVSQTFPYFLSSPLIVWRNCLLVVGTQKNDFSFPSLFFLLFLCVCIYPSKDCLGIAQSSQRHA